MFGDKYGHEYDNNRSQQAPDMNATERGQRVTKLKMEEAKLVEKQIHISLRNVKRNNRKKRGNAPTAELFPSVRHCNAALATFGDAGDFKRALKLFMQMRKVAATMRMSKGGSVFSSSDSRNFAENDSEMKRHVAETFENSKNSVHKSSIDLVSSPPKPNLVTYSTMMSRAVSLGKPRVALRLWNLMRNQPNFYVNVLSRKLRAGRIICDDAEQLVGRAGLQALEEDETIIVPDVICCNTLMNAYAKLGDNVMARSVLNSMLGANSDGGDSVLCHEGIPRTTPTVVTYNTLADACKVAGELGEALEVLQLMKDHASKTGQKPVVPDAMTYTILISTCARKSKQQQQSRDIRSGGERDPDMAFSLLDRMIFDGIKPNGVTYCALIDVCSRCRRVDLALNGLRIMLKQRSGANTTNALPRNQQRPLPNEVGAWTAAINACGKSGRTDTALRLFRTMQSFGVKPNAVTCGCLSDCLLKSEPMRIAETLEVLRYMKSEGLVPSEVMYTSLMDTATKVAVMENANLRVTKDGLHVQVVEKTADSSSTEKEINPNTTKAIVLYTELMRCLIQDETIRVYEKIPRGERNDGHPNMLLKVFLVFQEMKNSGLKPDIACYNSLLRACAKAGDIELAQDVLRRIEDDGLQPNRATWREAIKAAKNAKRSDFADEVWNTGTTYREKRSSNSRDVSNWTPNMADVELLMSVYVAETKSLSDHKKRILLHQKIIQLYEDIVHKRKINNIIDEFLENQKLMLIAVRACVSFVTSASKDLKEETQRAKDIACEIAGLECLQGKISSSVCDVKTIKALQLAQTWLYAF
ncbi:hypothetical protein ACHAXS_012140 [Conticribra weissflogii]